jgi:hypothetical protein
MQLRSHLEETVAAPVAFRKADESLFCSERICQFLHTCIIIILSALVPTQAPVQGVLVALAPEADYSPATSAEIKKM